MNDLTEFKEQFIFFINTTNATIKAFVELVADLVPIIGEDEANRLLNIIRDAQKGKIQ